MSIDEIVFVGAMIFIVAFGNLSAIATFVSLFGLFMFQFTIFESIKEAFWKK